ncbi:MAG TPA: kelch repeat-containing protein [Flavobacteriales bacterium]|nr:kelch repeat-containing protein [Flavobacteriales bacterium]
MLPRSTRSSCLRLVLLTLAAKTWVLPTQAQFTWTSVAPLPMPTANHALCAGQVNGVWNVYSFGGITTGLTNDQIHRDAFKYDVSLDQWSTLPGVPDALGKIAASASVVGTTAYVIGGYHVFDGAPFELSSNKVHRLDLLTDTWLPDGAPVPVPIDDQVQAVWRDSLIYVITGWSNNTNVPNVQVYDPALDTWSAGTPVPNNNQYKAFGANGTIISDTIYYFGGASTASNFPAQDRLRIGHIDPLQPMNITWLPAGTGGLGARYRPACVVVNDAPVWIGGSATSYNYDAVAYNGSGVVQPATEMLRWDGALMVSAGFTVPHVMDLRGAGALDNNSFIVAGGIGTSQTVLDSVWLVTADVVSIEEASVQDLLVAPNPTTGRCVIRFPSAVRKARFDLRDALGREVMSGSVNDIELRLDLTDKMAGVYVLHIPLENGTAWRATLIRE